MDDKIISIVMPIYQGEYNFYRNIEAFTNNKLKEIELIIVLDGVEFTTKNRCIDFESVDSRIKIIERDSTNFDAIEAGINATSGSYVLLLRANDMLSDETLDVALGYIKRYDFDIIFLKEEIYSLNKEAAGDENDRFIINIDVSNDIWVDLYLQGFINHQHAICKKDIVKDIKLKPDIYNYSNEYAEIITKRAKLLAYDSRCQYIVNADADIHNDDLVSIIVPVYNAEKYLDRCIDSLINQTYRNLEIILLVKESKDDSKKICSKYAQIDSRIYIYDQVSGGIGAARNQGLKLASGKYIYMCDADDYLISNAIENVYKYAKKTGADIVEFEFNTISENENLLFKGMFCLLAKMLGHEIRERYGNVSVWRYFTKRSLWEDNNIRFCETQVGEDLAVNSLLFFLSRQTRIIDSILYNYCIHSNSISTSEKETKYVKDNVRRITSKVIDDFKYRLLYKDYRNTLASQLENHAVVLLRKNLHDDEVCKNESIAWLDYYKKYADIKESILESYIIIVGREELQDKVVNSIYGHVLYGSMDDNIDESAIKDISYSSGAIIIFDLVNEYKRFLNNNDDLEEVISEIVAAVDKCISEVKKYIQHIKIVFVEDYLSCKCIKDDRIQKFDFIDDIYVINDILSVLYSLIQEKYSLCNIVEIPAFLRFSTDVMVDSINIYKLFWIKKKLDDTLRVWNYDLEQEDADLRKYEADKRNYVYQSKDYKDFLYCDQYSFPCLSDYREAAGNVDPHYFFQDIYVAKKIAKKRIGHIWDIGSRVDGYISHLLSMDIKVTMIDIRPLDRKISGLDYINGDACSLSGIADNSIEYLSSLHALEHFGLGRYGDSIDYLGYKKAIQSYKRVLKENGLLFLSVPVSKEDRLVFNAHRIFSPLTIIKEFGSEMKIQEFTFIQNGEYRTLNFESELDIQSIFQIISDIQGRYVGNYDCGIFIFKKE